MHEWQNPYIANGLVAMWDGIQHEQGTSTWKDLVNGLEIHLCEDAFFEWDNLHIKVAADATLTGKFMTLPYADAYTKLGTVFGGGTGYIPYQCTTIACFRYDPSAMTSASGSLMCFDENGGGNTFFGRNATSWTRGYGGGPMKINQTSASDETRNVVWCALASNVGELIDEGHTDTYKLYAYGSPWQSQTITYDSSHYARYRTYKRPCLAGSFRDMTLNAKCYNPSVGECRDILFHSIFIYNRVLSDAEIAANYAVDKKRFNLPDPS